MKTSMKKLRNTDLDKDKVLRAFGLQTRRGMAGLVAPAAYLIGGSLLVGAAIGLMFAPKSGNKLRRDVARTLGEVGDGLARTFQRTARAASARLHT